ncbi:MAG TPA: hypothetical protein VGP31_15220 [Planosporangium sp.]|nr:hypothetical protein [Planosporangium sp.]
MKLSIPTAAPARLATRASSTVDAPRAARPRWPRRRGAGLLVHAAFLAAACYVMAHLWADPLHRVLALNPSDQAFGEWMFADQAYAITHFRTPFFSHGQNAPLGINLMGNAATQLIAWILAPVTLLFGPEATFALVITLNLAATASAWYHVLSRHLVRHRAAAFLGAAFCGFSPGMISESNAHVHIPTQFLVPLMVWAVIRLREPGRVVRNGVVLGLLVSAQVLIGEEVLFLTALGCGLMAAGFAVMRWREARTVLVPFLSGLAVAGAVVLIVCGYPLWMQFFGPRHYRGLIATYSADLTTFFSFPTQSVGGLTGGRAYVPNHAEEAAFFGWPLALGAIGLGVLLWRSMAARLATIVGAICAVLALGDKVMWKERYTGVPGPYRLLSHLPVFDSLITLRLSLVTAVAIGLLLAFGTEWVLDRAPAAREAGVPLRAVAAVAAVAVLVPLVPRPLPAVGRPFVPRFITSGEWRAYVREGRTLVPVDPAGRTPLRWGVAARAHFAVPGGFTLVPKDPPRDMTGVFNVPGLPTEARLWTISMGYPIEIGPADRKRAVDDMRYLRADAVVLNAMVPDSADMAGKIASLLGRPAQRVDDVYVWPVRDI